MVHSPSSCSSSSHARMRVGHANRCSHHLSTLPQEQAKCAALKLCIEQHITACIRSKRDRQRTHPTSIEGNCQENCARHTTHPANEGAMKLQRRLPLYLATLIERLLLSDCEESLPRSSSRAGLVPFAGTMTNPMADKFYLHHLARCASRRECGQGEAGGGAGNSVRRACSAAGW